MSILLSSSEEACINRDTVAPISPISLEELSDFFELDRVTKEISGFSRIALQFPDSLLQYSVPVIRLLRDCLPSEARLVILADTTAGSCCADETAAAHAAADCLVHFGASCFTPARILPVVTVLGGERYDVAALLRQLDSPALVVCDSRWWRCSLAARPLLEAAGHQLCSPKDCPSSGENKPELVVFIGERDSLACAREYLRRPATMFLSFNPLSAELLVETPTANKLLMRRFFLVEKARDATRVGLIASSLTTPGLAAVIEHLRVLAAGIGKRVYVLSVGKINVPKLANFPEMDIFVLLGCPVTSLLDSAEFYRPVLTTHEFELACNPAREWTGRVDSDFTHFLADGEDYVPQPEGLGFTDVSLITGKLRHMAATQATSAPPGLQLQVRGRQPLALRYENSALAFLSGERSWRGLEPALGETEVAELQQGRSGTARGYSQLDHDETDQV